MLTNVIIQNMLTNVVLKNPCLQKVVLNLFTGLMEIVVSFYLGFKMLVSNQNTLFSKTAMGDS